MASAHTILAKTASMSTSSFLLESLGCITAPVALSRSKPPIPHPTRRNYSSTWRVLKTSRSIYEFPHGRTPKRGFPLTANARKATFFQENSSRCHELGRMEIEWSLKLECRFACKRWTRRTRVRWHWSAGRLPSLALAICPQSLLVHSFSPLRLHPNLQKTGWCRPMPGEWHFVLSRQSMMNRIAYIRTYRSKSSARAAIDLDLSGHRRLSSGRAVNSTWFALSVRAEERNCLGWPARARLSQGGLLEAPHR